MAGKSRRSYKGAPVSNTLGVLLSAGGTTITLASALSGWPTGSEPFFVVIDPGTSKEEKVCVKYASSTTLTVVDPATVSSWPASANGRGADGTTDRAHDAGATIYPVFTAYEADQANELVSKYQGQGAVVYQGATTFQELTVGTAGQVLKVNSGATAPEWGQVATAGITDLAVTTAKIADLNVTAGKLATAALKLLCPVGTIVAYGGAAAPTGWLLCDGSSISVSYTELRALVGTTTPDIRGRFPIGDNASLTLLGTGGSATISEANLPSHTHAMKSHTHTVSGVTIYDSGSSGNWGVLATNQTGNINAFIQTTATSPTGGPNDNTSNATGSGTDYYPPYYVVNYIIKHDY